MPGEEAGPLARLEPEDQEFIVRLVLASGSLKELASGYGVSYPTIRARLDRVIERLGRLVDGREADPMTDLVIDLIEKGQVPAGAGKRLLETHRQQVKKAREKPS
jgi:hypothetical protein